jgi:hypothetical protein
MRDPSYQYDAFVVIDRVNDPVVADSYPVVVTACKLYDAVRPRLFLECVDCRLDPLAKWTLKSPIGARGLGMQPDLVRAFGLAGYPLTSCQGMAASPSSRA